MGATGLLPADAKQQLKINGFVIVDLLSDAELEQLRQALAPAYELALAERAAGRIPPRSNFGLGLFEDRLPLTAAQWLPCDPRILAMCETLLGPQPVLGPLSFRIHTAGAEYRQGWHRDVQQVVGEEVDARWFSDEVAFNCLQLNLPLYDDAALWVVPGSHRRRNTAAETAAFGGAGYLAPDAAEMPGGVPVTLAAGQIVLYNNNLIHRGYSEQRVKRIMYHTNYHSAERPPSWHFYSAALLRLTPPQVAKLSPELRSMHRRCCAAREAYPEIRDSYTVPS